MKKDYIFVKCCICQKEYERPRYRVRFERNYCSDCHRAVEVYCEICGKTVRRWRSTMRNYSCRRGSRKIYCSIICKALAQRKEWNNLGRRQLKQRYMKEFGIQSLKCVRCGHDKIYNIEIHHKIYCVNGGDNNPTNLEPLCCNCHGIEHYEHGKDNKE